jgi:hypothetical protein
MSISVSHITETERMARPPQFGLRTLLLTVTALSILFAVFAAVGPMWSAMLAMVFSLVGLHVAGNALGTRLRDDAPRLVEIDKPVGTEDPAPLQMAPEFPAATRLQEHASIDYHCWIAAAAGALLGASIGGICVAGLVGERLTLPGLLLGITSSAMLGGLFCFLASSLFLVARTAWQEALQSLDDAPPGPHAS